MAKLFAAIFVTIGPVLAMLEAGFDGPLAPLLRLTVDGAGQPVPLAYFWLTGLLSAFLDNAPTYLVFFELAGGDPVHLTGPLTMILVAISAGAVFFGALTYIGNAPNMMVRAIASHRGVRMPGFFGYMRWSCALLLPCFLLLSWCSSVRRPASAMPCRNCHPGAPPMTYLVADDLPAAPAGERFRALLARPGILQMPGAHNGHGGAAGEGRGLRGAVSLRRRDDRLDGHARSRHDHGGRGVLLRPPDRPRRRACRCWSTATPATARR